MQKGQKHKKQTRSLQSISALKRDNTNRIASLPKKENHWNWSEKPSLLTMHKRIHRQYGSAKQFKCITQCGKQAIDWALIGTEYSDKKEDYEPMCRKCHMNMDKPWLKRKTIIAERNKKGQIVRTVHKVI